MWTSIIQKADKNKFGKKKKEVNRNLPQLLIMRQYEDNEELVE